MRRDVGYGVRRKVLPLLPKTIWTVGGNIENPILLEEGIPGIQGQCMDRFLWLKGLYFLKIWVWNGSLEDPVRVFAVEGAVGRSGVDPGLRLKKMRFKEV